MPTFISWWHPQFDCYRFWQNVQVDDMVDMYDDARSKYEAVLDHMKERICERQIDPSLIQSPPQFFQPHLNFEFPERKERSAASPPPPPCLDQGGRLRCWDARRTPAQESPSPASRGRTLKAASVCPPMRSPTRQSATFSSTTQTSSSVTTNSDSEELAAQLEGCTNYQLFIKPTRNFKFIRSFTDFMFQCKMQETSSLERWPREVH